MGDRVAHNDDPENFFTLITPTHRMGNAGTFWCIEKAHLAGVPFIWIPHPGDALIGRSRSIEASRVLDGSYPSPYAIFLDSDIVFEPEDLMKLWSHLKSGKELIGGCYVVRSGVQMAHYGKGENGAIHIDGSVQEIDYLSTGFMGFTRGLLRRIVDELKLPLCHPDSKGFTCWPFFESGAHFYEANGHWIYRSEDWDFCDKARKVGVEPLLDTSIQVGHEGFHIWKMEHLPAAQQAKKKEALLQVVQQMPSKDLKHFIKQGKRAVREGKSSPLVLPLGGINGGRHSGRA